MMRLWVAAALLSATAAIALDAQIPTGETPPAPPGQYWYWTVNVHYSARGDDGAEIIVADNVERCFETPKAATAARDDIEAHGFYRTDLPYWDYPARVPAAALRRLQVVKFLISVPQSCEQ